MPEADLTTPDVATPDVIDPPSSDGALSRGPFGLTSTQLTIALLIGAGLTIAAVVWWLSRTPPTVTPCGCGDPPVPHVHATEATEVMVPTDVHEEPQ